MDDGSDVCVEGTVVLGADPDEAGEVAVGRGLVAVLVADTADDELDTLEASAPVAEDVCEVAARSSLRGLFTPTMMSTTPTPARARPIPNVRLRFSETSILKLTLPTTASFATETSPPMTTRPTPRPTAGPLTPC